MSSQTKSSLKWSAVERLAVQLIQLVVMLYLAKVLGPEAFGLIGMLAVFIAVCQIFVDSGISSALIRKLDSSDVDYSTAFYINIIISVVVYSLLFFSAPLISKFYGLPELVDLVRVLGCIVLITPFSLIQRTILTSKMDFKSQAKASLSAVFISSVVAVTLALYDFGVWSLVGQTVVMNLLNALILNFMNPWKPKLVFSSKSASYLYSFGSKLLLSGLIDTIYKNIYQIIIGKKFNANEVGLFTQANQLASTPARTLTTIIQRVTYPLLSKIQDDESKLVSSYLISLKFSSLVIFPVMVGLAFISPVLIPLLLGEEWTRSAEFIGILCFGFMLLPIHSINLNLLQVKNRTSLFLKLEIIKKLLTTIILFITVPISIKAICYGIILQSYLALFINTYYTGQLTNLTAVKQLTELFPIWATSILSCYFAYQVSLLLDIGSIARLTLYIAISLILYILFITVIDRKLVKQFISLTISKKKVDIYG